MNRHFILIILAVILILINYGLYAQDIVSNFYQGNTNFNVTNIGEITTNGQSKQNRSLIKFGGKLFNLTSVITPVQLSNYQAYNSFPGDLYLEYYTEPYGGFLASVNYNYLTAYFQNDGVQVSTNTNYLSIGELYLDIPLGNAVFIRVGDQLSHWGAGQFWTPEDFINTSKFDPLALADFRGGIEGAMLRVPYPGGNIYFLADFNNTFPLTSVSTDIINATALIERTEASIGDYVYGLTVYYKSGTEPIFGFDFSRLLSDFKLYGEGAYSPHGYVEKADAVDVTPVLIQSDNPVFTFTLGGSESFGDMNQWLFYIDFYYNSDGYDDNDLYRELMSKYSYVFQPLYIGKYYMHAGITGSKFMADELNTDLKTVINLSDGSYYIRLSFIFNMNGFLPFTLSASYSGGGEDREFTISGNNSLGFNLSMMVEF